MHVNPTVIQRQRTMRTDENNAVKGHVAQTRNKQKTNKEQAVYLVYHSTNHLWKIGIRISYHR